MSPRNGESSFSTEVSTNLMNTIGHLSKLLRSEPTEMDYLLEGKLKLNIPLVKSIPFSESGNVDLND